MSIGETSLGAAIFPRLPPEIIGIIIKHLGDSKADLLTCSLVGRGWLPLARSNLPDVTIKPASALTFVELIKSPKTTLVTTLRCLHLHSHDPDNSLVLRPVITLLPNFVSLRLLFLQCDKPEDLTALPELTELGLCCIEFPSHSSFVRFMADLPALQHLQLIDVSWATDPEAGQWISPFSEIKSKELSWDDESLIQMCSFFPQKLRLVFPVFHPSFLWFSTISRYLRHLSTCLKHLELETSDEFGQYPTSHGRDLKFDEIYVDYTLDFSSNAALASLKIIDRVKFYAKTIEFSAMVSPALEGWLSRIMSYARVEDLILQVSTYHRCYTKIGWIPLSQFPEFLDSPPFATMRTIEFVVDGSPYCLKGFVRLFSDRFEPILRAAIPSRNDCQILCSAEKDSEEVYC
ncbi:hypothetical protein DFH09DRAFT_1324353 [Mycena vulgaris]|nr:hypothetical protein DFH09DRAFT_1324353 [Mycena vulgaris]